MGTSSLKRLLGFLFLFNVAIYFFLQPGYLIPDGVGYLAYLPVVFAQHTLSFFSFFNTVPMGLPLARTSTGWVANLWPFGLSFLGLPFYETTRLYRHVSGSSNAPDWSALYLGNLNLASMLFGGASAFFLYDLLSTRLRVIERQLLTLICFFGTPLFFYTFCIAATAHAASAFASGLFLWFWLKTRAPSKALSGDAARWFALGLLGGIAAMVRTQEIFILIAPLWEWGRVARPALDRQKVLRLALLTMGVCAGFFPQALLWKALYGGYFYSPQIFNFSPTNFALGKSLFSSYHGLFAWTPLFVMACAGLVRAIWRGSWEARPLLAILILQILVNSFYTAWWDMLSFSLRLLTGTFVIAGFGIGGLFEPVRSSGQREVSQAGLWMALVGCALWSLLLALHGYAGSLDLRVFYPWHSLLRGALNISSLVYGWRHTLWRYGKVPPIEFLFWGCFELAMMGWLWGLKRQTERGPRGLSRMLCWTFGPWILYASLCILRAQRAPRPALPDGLTMEAQDLGRIFVADSLNGKARYWLLRRRPDLSLNAVEEAERLLPLSPSTQNFRDEFERLRLSILRAKEKI